MMNIKKMLSKAIPTSIKSILKGETKQKEIQNLKAVKTIACDASKLLSKNEVSLPSLFNSEAINAAWIESKKNIDTFSIPDFTGGVNPGDRRAIFYLINYFKPKSVLEIGTHIGASTINIASALYQNQVNDGIKSTLKSLDVKDVNSASEKPWLQSGTKKSPLEMIKSLNFETFVQFITDTSFNYFEATDETFDFIFLDGDHSADTVYKEIPYALKKLNKGGVILLHDYFPNGVPLWSNNAIIEGPYLATERHSTEGANTIVVPLGELPWATKLDSNTTSLALLLKKD